MKVTDTFSGSKVPKATKILYPAGTIFRDSAYTLVSLFFMMFVQYCAPLGYSWVNTGTMDTSLYTTQMLVISAIIIVLRIWDGFNDPIMPMNYLLNIQKRERYISLMLLLQKNFLV